MFAQLLVVILIGATCPILIAGEQAVHHRIGITTDRRGEVGVVVEGQTIVTYVMRRVLSLHHSPQGECLHQLLLTFALSILHQLVEVLRDGTLGAAGLHLITKRCQRCT